MCAQEPTISSRSPDPVSPASSITSAVNISR